jgi:hypothetical protein
MDWRPQMTSLAIGGVLEFIPFVAYFGPARVSSWNFVASVMQYLVIGGLVIAVLGLLWQGPIGRESVLVQFGLSIAVGALMSLVSFALIADWFTLGEGCPDPTMTRRFVALAEYPAATLLPLGLLIPALSFTSSIVWIIRHRAAFTG